MHAAAKQLRGTLLRHRMTMSFRSSQGTTRSFRRMVSRLKLCMAPTQSRGVGSRSV